MSKFSLDVLKRRIFPFVEAHDPDIILGAVFGEDVGTGHPYLFQSSPRGLGLLRRNSGRVAHRSEVARVQPNPLLEGLSFSQRSGESGCQTETHEILKCFKE